MSIWIDRYTKHLAGLAKYVEWFCKKTSLDPIKSLEKIHCADEVRAQYERLINALHEMGEREQAEELARLAVRQGVWKYARQRPVHFIDSIPSIPVHDSDQFWLARYLEQHFEAIRTEVEAVTDPDQKGFAPVEESYLVERGKWDQVVFYEKGLRFDRPCRTFPKTARILETIPSECMQGVVALFWLHPGSHIKRHCGGTNARLRVHLGIKVPAGAGLCVDDQHLTWREGKCLVFDDSFEHEVWNFSNEPRVVLLFDMFHPSLPEKEKNILMKERTSIQDKIKLFMKEKHLSRIEWIEKGDHVLSCLDEVTEKTFRRYMEGSHIRGLELRDGRLNFEYDESRV